MAISPYLAALRRRLGHDLILVPSVTALVRNDAGEILFARSRESGRWQTLGGAVDPDESPADAARREAFEEAGVAIELGPILAALGGPEFRLIYANGDAVAYVSTVFDARITSGTPTPDGDEISELCWRAPDDLASLDLDELNRALIEAVLGAG
jgi:8-oxo-dGTP pyrophosphatase MutT (NUDIX family)